jgi:hypothetical protein
MNLMTFHSVGNGIIIPTDEVHDFSGGLVETTNQSFHELGIQF